MIASLMTEPTPRSTYVHVPVLGHEVGSFFRFGRPALVVDGTLGLGGHSEILLQRYPDVRVFGIEWDPRALDIARGRLARWGDRFRAVEGSYTDLPEILRREHIASVDGLLLDLGLSSLQLQDAARGFSFLAPGPLDMRMSPTARETAWDLLTRRSEEELAELFKTLGEEPFARRIAQAIKAALASGRLRDDALAVAQIMRRAVPPTRQRIDPATRCFQALRISVNRELENVDRVLEQLASVLSRGGRAAIIAFHSLEDRRVKRFFQQAARGCVCPPRAPQCVCGQEPWARIGRKAIQADEAEIQRNPRARSARMRTLEKI